MFSNRTPADFELNPLACARAERRRAGARLIDLTETNPTRVGVSPTVAEIAAAFGPAFEERHAPTSARATVHDAAHYDPDPRGLLVAREAISDYYADRGCAVPPDRILLAASTSEAYANLFRLLGDAGDEFLVPRPSYPLIEPLASLECVRLAAYPLRYAGRWTLDPSEIERALTPRTRAVIVVNPNNPTGSFVAPYAARALESLCVRRGVVLIADEVFGDFALDASAPRRATFADARDPLTFVLSGLSKVAGLPQLKLAWIAVAGPAALAEPAIARLEWVADALLSVATPVQLALPRLLAGRRAFQERTLARLRANRAHLIGALAARPDLEALATDGGWTAVVRVPRTRSEEEWALALLARDVVVHPGHYYDFEEEAYLVVSLLPEQDVFAEGVARLVELSGDAPTR